MASQKITVCFAQSIEQSISADIHFKLHNRLYRVRHIQAIKLTLPQIKKFYFCILFSMKRTLRKCQKSAESVNAVVYIIGNEMTNRT